MMRPNWPVAPVTAMVMAGNSFSRYSNDDIGTHRFSALPHNIGGVSKRMLAQTLQLLEADGYFGAGASTMIGTGVDHANSTKSMGRRSPRDANGGHFSISIHTDSYVERPGLQDLCLVEQGCGDCAFTWTLRPRLRGARVVRSGTGQSLPIAHRH
ncbi:winged helix-turn-helix transcriptional regulator [Nitrobacter vulgaris]|uniref:winged helix-turn-helix transcriptional regulator n=1 Tax=Nitrobacter vulgaris TaxID=29421 RepID=UPI00191C8624